MRVFELHFNPKLKEDLIFDSFCYEPENVYERRLGGLYIVGELKNALPQNFNFLNKLAQVIKGKFYAFPIVSLEKSFEGSLKALNEFLTEEVKKDNTSWLGNLSLAAISLKNLDLNFTKVGDLKILLLRNGQVTDIGERLKFQEIEPYPLKIFGNIVSGKLIEKDQVLIFTKDVFSTFAEGYTEESLPPGSLLSEIAQVSVEEKSYERKLRKILKEKGKTLSEISGIYLSIILKPELLPKKVITFEKEAPVFSLSQVFKPIITKIRGFPKFFKKILSFRPEVKISLPPKKAFSLPGLSRIKEKIRISSQIDYQKFLKKSITFPEIKFSQEIKKKLILILALIFFLILGYFIFKK